jgi:hypothetical protein
MISVFAAPQWGQVIVDSKSTDIASRKHPTKDN